MNYLQGLLPTSDPVASAQKKVDDLNAQLKTAQEELAAAQTASKPSSGTIADGVTGGKRRTRRSKKVKRSRTGKKSNRS